MNMSHICEGNDFFQVETHPDYKRIFRVVLADSVIDEFLRLSDKFSVTSLEYVPFKRFVLADCLAHIAGNDFAQILRTILLDRDSGALSLGLSGRSDELDDFIRLATAVTHLIGIPNFDAMTGNYYARFVVQHSDDSDSYLRKAYTPLSLHTDGTYVDETTDWLLMMKMAEQHVQGGRSRLLHLDDWEELERFSQHAMASQLLTYKAPPSKNIKEPVYRQTFYPDDNDRPCLCFIDQFVYPDNREQALYLDAMLSSMETSPATRQVELPVGDMLLLNNHFWVHGREAFQPDNDLYRELMRLRGYFSHT